MLQTCFVLQEKEETWWSAKKKWWRQIWKNIKYNEKRVTKDPKLEESGNFDFSTSNHKNRFNEFLSSSVCVILSFFP